MLLLNGYLAGKMARPCVRVTAFHWLLSCKTKPSIMIRSAILSILFIALLTGCAKRQEDPHSGNDEIYVAVEHPAEFPGGLDAFYAYVKANIHYPEQAIKDNVQGKVYVTFVVEKDGSLTDIKVMQGIGDGCDEEAVRLIKASPKWNPGEQNGVIVRQQYTVPVNFDYKQVVEIAVYLKLN